MTFLISDNCVPPTQCGAHAVARISAFLLDNCVPPTWCGAHAVARISALLLDDKVFLLPGVVRMLWPE